MTALILASHPAGEPADGGAVLGVVALFFLFLMIAGGKRK